MRSWAHEKNQRVANIEAFRHTHGQQGAWLRKVQEVVLERKNNLKLEQAELSKHLFCKGSLCIGGLSPTVNDVDGGRCGVCLIPHTLAVTTLERLAPRNGGKLEVDFPGTTWSPCSRGGE